MPLSSTAPSTWNWVKQTHHHEILNKKFENYNRFKTNSDNRFAKLVEENKMEADLNVPVFYSIHCLIILISLKSPRSPKTSIYSFFFFIP